MTKKNNRRNLPVNLAKNHKEAEEWDINQHLNMTPQERQRVAKELKIRFFGEKNVDIREYYRK